VQQVTTGLAVDEGQGLVFISYPDFGTGANWIIVSLLANPCQPVFRFQAPVCPGFVLGPILGLGVNWCRRILYATDGRSTIGMQYVWAAPALTITGVSCCAPPVVAVDSMIGLCVRPGRATPSGGPCANGACPPCPMVHSLANDPNLGNLSFRLDLTSAPTGALAWCRIGFGPCLPGGPVLPPLCGPLLPGPGLGNLGPVVTGGIGGCTGAATFNMALPLIPAFCGVILSSQCVAICPSAAGGFGTTMSNCLTWQLQGS
jgi:hypothetical protein